MPQIKAVDVTISDVADYYPSTDVEGALADAAQSLLFHTSDISNPHGVTFAQVGAEPTGAVISHAALTTTHGVNGALVGTTDTQTLSNKTLTAVKETRVSMAASDIDLSTGNLFSKTITADTTFTTSNVPAAGQVATFVLDLTNGGAYLINWWAGVKWAGGIPPSLTSTGRDVLGFFTHDGGMTWNGLVLGKDMK